MSFEFAPKSLSPGGRDEGGKDSLNRLKITKSFIFTPRTWRGMHSVYYDAVFIFVKKCSAGNLVAVIKFIQDVFGKGFRLVFHCFRGANDCLWYFKTKNYRCYTPKSYLSPSPLVFDNPYTS